MKNSVGKLPYLAAAASATIFGFSFLFTKNALDTLGMNQLVGLRFMTAALLMWLLKALKLIKVEINTRKIKPLALVALFQPILYFVFETTGVDLTSASEAGIIVSLIPVAVAFSAAVLLKEKLSKAQWIAVFASVFGVVLISLPGLRSGTGSHLTGVLALLGAVMAGGLYNIYSKKASGRATPIEVTYVMMWAGAIFFNVVGLITTPNPVTYFGALANLNALLAVLYLGVLSSVIAFIALNYSLSKISASEAAIFMNLTPIVSVFAGITFRAERFSLIQFVGSVIILLGVWVVTTAKRGENF